MASRQPAPGSGPPSGAPSLTARILAFAAILIAGACGGVIGYAVVDLQCSGDCALLKGLGTLAGAGVAAAGVAVVAVLTLRAMGEWVADEEARSRRRNPPKG